MALSIGELNGYLGLDIAGFSDNVKDALGQLKSKDWKKAGAIAGGLSGAALAAGFKSSMDLQSANAQTAAQLGLTEDQAAVSGKVAGKLYSEGLGESMEDVSNATGSVMGAFSDLRNASQSDIEAASRSALQFSKVMGTDVGDSAKTAGILVKNGLAKDPQEAFDLLTAASQKAGPQMVEPLMDAVDEYSKHFAMVGMDGKDAMSILSEAAAGGEISIDKAGDAIKEFGIRATDLGDKGAQDALKALGLDGEQVANDLLAGGDKAKKATQTIADSLLDVKDPAKQASLASGLFGTQIEDIGKDQLPGFLGALSGAQDSLGETAGATDKAAKTMSDTAGAKLAKFGRKIQTTLMDMAAPAVEWITPLLDGLGAIAPLIGPLVVGLGALAGAVALVNGGVAVYNAVMAVAAAWPKVAAAAQWLWNAALSANPIGIVVAAIAALVGGLVLFFTKTETGRKIWASVWGGIKAAAAAVADWFTGTLVPILQAAWDGISAAAIWLWQSVFVPVWAGIRAAVGAVAGWVTGTLVPALAAAWQAIATAAQWLYTNVIQPVWTGIKVAIAVVVAVVMTYIQMWVAVFRNVLAPVFTWLYRSVILPVWNAIKSAIGAVVSWFQNTAWPLLRTVIGYVQGRFILLRRKLLETWAAIRDKIIAPVVAWFRDTVAPLFERVIGYIKGRFVIFHRKLQEVWGAIKNNVIAPVYSWFKNTVVAGFKTAVDNVKAGFEFLKSKLSAVWKAVRNTIISPVYSWFKNTVVAGFTTALGTVRSKFQAMKDKLSSIWKAVRHNVIQPVYGWFKNTVVGGLKTAADKISSAFKTMKSAVGKAWDGVKAKAKAPIKFVVDTVINKGIVKNFNKIAGKFGVGKLSEVSAGFASGGVLPGYTPGRDVHSFYSPSLGRLDLSGGEAIMRPEFTRAVGGPRGVARLNAAAINGQSFSDAFSTGGVYGAASAGRHAYAGGGVLSWIKDKASKGANWLKDKASWVKDVVSDPLGVFKTFAKDLLGGTPAAGLMTDLGKAAINKVASNIGNFLKGKNDETPGGVPAGTGKGGSLGWASSVAKRFGLTMTSGYRPGARTSSGSLSMHAQNRARDYSNGWETPQEMRFFNYILANSKPTELLYTPAGARNVHRGGRQYANSGTLARIHHNHVHVAYKRGGVLGDLAGRGYASGTLNATPGWHMVGEQGPELVRFRGGEQVKNARDTRDHVAQSGAVSVTNHFHEVGGEAAEVAAQRVQNRMIRSMREAVRG
ncbi:hypothetical protein [Brachybacterium sp. NPDC056505]|uniref:hypothetical protein n=1 Tax=Brachybacterium sp. NPDC056505 TaxID=3345843 RepID=UPI00366BA222